MTPDEFINRWKSSGSSERGNFQQFLIELTSLIGVEAPKPVTADGAADDYRFERPVRSFSRGTVQFIDLYRKGCFVMEAKQGADAREDSRQLTLLEDIQRSGHGVRGTRRWDDSMVRARGQADRYARDIARTDGWPPFLLVVDVGHVIEVYADFSGQGQGYSQFPDKTRYRLKLEDLANSQIRQQLRAIWTDPLSLDPSKISAKVTREIAGHLAELGKSFEGQGHSSEKVARFLMRCLFAMFAEDVHLIPKDSFKDLLIRLRGQPEMAQPVLTNLFRAMDKGEPSDSLMTRLMRFNGGLFADAEALPLDRVQLSLLIAAAQCDWTNVEPAIFGTLLERALDTRQRHKLGAHYTPRAYVERLVNPVLMEPLRQDWDAARASAIHHARQGDVETARRTVSGFQDYLCSIRVLDPACGSGNFLYVSLELMKRLEGEVTAFAADLGEDQASLSLAGHTVDPHQFLGIELNPWAAAVAELVLWIGYLQWHFRTHGKASPAEPVLRDFKNIENRDAVLTWAETRPQLDAEGRPVSRWDGQTTLIHPVTGERVPDPEARVQVLDYLKPQPAKWPEAEFIVGNPPFIGNKRMRDALGDGYTEALRAAYPKMPHSADFVMFWWEKAALAARGWKPATEKTPAKGTRRFGFITTNSLRQTFNRKVLEPHLNDSKTPLSLAFAIPDHPWVDAGDGAAVRIAMTVAEAGKAPGRLGTVADERRGEYEAEGRPVRFVIEKGKIFADLRIGADVAGSTTLHANKHIAYQGVIPGGEGFFVSKREAQDGFQAESKAGLVRRYLNGRELVHFAEPRYIFDATGFSEAELKASFPRLYQHLLDTVKPIRDNVKRESRKQRWWIYSEANVTMRPMFKTIPRYIATCRTAKHRVFGFLASDILPDAKLIAIGLDDGWHLSVLSSRSHVVWATSAGAWLGVGNDSNYNHAQCFNPFPFPDPTETQKARLRSLGEQLDAHRKAQQKAHPKLTLTAMYNVLETLRAGERIEGKDRETYDQGLIGILRDLHGQIDAAVAEAYGWPVDLSDDDILHRLVALNRERSDEEARGLVRWLRPEYQNPAGHAAAVKAEQIEAELGAAVTPGKAPWPKSLPSQIAAVQATLEELGEATPEEIARRFVRARVANVQPLLESLSIIGRAEASADGRYHLS